MHRPSVRSDEQLVLAFPSGPGTGPAGMRWVPQRPSSADPSAQSAPLSPALAHGFVLRWRQAPAPGRLEPHSTRRNNGQFASPQLWAQYALRRRFSSPGAERRIPPSLPQCHIPDGGWRGLGLGSPGGLLLGAQGGAATELVTGSGEPWARCEKKKIVCWREIWRKCGVAPLPFPPPSEYGVSWCLSRARPIPTWLPGHQHACPFAPRLYTVTVLCRLYHV